MRVTLAGHRQSIYVDEAFAVFEAGQSTTTDTSTTTTTTTTTPPPPPSVTVPPPAPTATPESAPDAGCHRSYEPCVPIASDVDCAGGSGNGPEYTGAVRVVGPDEYNLDAAGDGFACE